MVALQVRRAGVAGVQSNVPGRKRGRLLKLDTAAQSD